MKILVTGCAGFIGFHLCLALLARGKKVFGVDNLNNYYDPELKDRRLEEIRRSENSKNFHFFKQDISDNEFIQDLFKREKFDFVINLAAQAGVRHSITNPSTYVNSNINGYLNILEGCKNNQVKHLVYASSSSVYGMNKRQPFRTNDNTDYPISMYAATKKSNELMSHCYSHLYKLPITGLRFFTVYGPFGRPDMAYYKFSKKIYDNKPIDVYNNGNMKRDFTYISDIIDGILKIYCNPPSIQPNLISNSKVNHVIYNIGNNQPVTLSKFISLIEKYLDQKAVKNFLEMQPGDVPKTYADISTLSEKFNFSPKVKIEEGLKEFIAWFKSYHDNK